MTGRRKGSHRVSTWLALVVIITGVIVSRQSHATMDGGNVARVLAISVPQQRYAIIVDEPVQEPCGTDGSICEVYAVDLESWWFRRLWIERIPEGEIRSQCDRCSYEQLRAKLLEMYLGRARPRSGSELSMVVSVDHDKLATRHLDMSDRFSQAVISPILNGWYAVTRSLWWPLDGLDVYTPTPVGFTYEMTVTTRSNAIINVSARVSTDPKGDESSTTRLLAEQLATFSSMAALDPISGRYCGAKPIWTAAPLGSPVRGWWTEAPLPCSSCRQIPWWVDSERRERAVCVGLGRWDDGTSCSCNGRSLWIALAFTHNGHVIRGRRALIEPHELSQNVMGFSSKKTGGHIVVAREDTAVFIQPFSMHIFETRSGSLLAVGAVTQAASLNGTYIPLVAVLPASVRASGGLQR